VQDSNQTMVGSILHQQDMANQMAQASLQNAAFGGLISSNQSWQKSVLRPVRKGWHVDIEQLEDGFVVTVGLLDTYNTKPRQYVATSVDEALQKITVGVVAEKLEK
jgi:hypothetical protein